MRKNTPDLTFGGIEAGGTKFMCAIGTHPEDIQAQTRFPTTSPEETLNRTITFFQEHNFPLAAIGIGSFGPLDLRPGSSTHGYITTTPKPGWSQTDIAGALRRSLNVPVVIDTDVNAAAQGESCWGAARGLKNFLYLTIGTGVGGGGMVNGALVHGMLHPEMGHMRIPHSWERDPFPGICPFHGDCLEGLASGPAMAARWGKPGDQLPPDHPAWDLEAEYLAASLHNLICVFSPQRIVLGGGVMSHTPLLAMVRTKIQMSLNKYISAPEIIARMETYIVPPELGALSGVLGALALAQKSIANHQRG